MNDLLPLWAVPALTLWTAALWAPRIFPPMFHYLRAHKTWTRPLGVLVIGFMEVVVAVSLWDWIKCQDAKLMSTSLPLVAAAFPAYFLWVFRNADKREELDQGDRSHRQAELYRALDSIAVKEEPSRRQAIRALLQFVLDPPKYPELVQAARFELSRFLEPIWDQSTERHGEGSDHNLFIAVVIAEFAGQLSRVLSELPVRNCSFQGGIDIWVVDKSLKPGQRRGENHSFTSIEKQKFIPGTVLLNHFSSFCFQSCRFLGPAGYVGFTNCIFKGIKLEGNWDYLTLILTEINGGSIRGKIRFERVDQSSFQSLWLDLVADFSEAKTGTLLKIKNCRGKLAIVGGSGFVAIEDSPDLEITDASNE